MGVITPYIPTPGAAAPGNLYADLQSRTLWLGVDPAVDANQAVLISDILSLQSQIVAGDAASKNYTDTAITSLAPLVDPVFTGNPRAPTPSPGDNDTSIATTGFVTAAIAAGATGQWAKGMIMMYSGLLSDVGVGVLAGWALCDGGGIPARPDLRDRFIIGAGNLSIGAKNPLATVNTDNDGGHTPVVNSTTLTLAQTPAHSHTWSDSGTFRSGGRTAAHTHTVADASYNFVGWKTSGGANLGTTWGPSGQPLQSFGTTSGESADHAHDVTVSLSGTTDSKGSSGGHTHTVVAVPAHNHGLTSSQIRDVLPYYALAYIIKL